MIAGRRDFYLKEMKFMKRLGAVLCLAVAGLLAHNGGAQAAASFSGTLANDASVATDTLHLTGDHYVFHTLSYAGGVLANGTVIPAGGFDPVVTVFSGTTVSGTPIGSNDDGNPAQVPFDPTTFQYYDSYLLLTLPTGNYTIALTQSDNFWNVSTQAWTQTDPLFTEDAFHNNGASLCGNNPFCDATGAQRSNAFVLEILPEPAGALPLIAGLVAMAGALRRRSARG